MSNVGAWIAGLLAAACILGLLIFIRPAQHNQRAAWLIVRGTSAQQAEAKAPPANWLLIRRIPHQ
jgi:hypothetical protein